jgi:hypothetical protein
VSCWSQFRLVAQSGRPDARLAVDVGGFAPGVLLQPSTSHGGELALAIFGPRP